jgi:hypothetical protein
MGFEGGLKMEVDASVWDVLVYCFIIIWGYLVMLGMGMVGGYKAGVERQTDDVREEILKLEVLGFTPKQVLANVKRFVRKE